MLRPNRVARSSRVVRAASFATARSWAHSEALERLGMQAIAATADTGRILGAFPTACPRSGCRDARRRSSSVGVGTPASQLKIPAVRIQTLWWPRRDDSLDRAAVRRCRRANGGDPRQVANRHIGPMRPYGRDRVLTSTDHGSLGWCGGRRPWADHRPRGHRGSETQSPRLIA
jgi:hypothetical protein